MTVTYGTVFSQEQYMSIARVAAEYMRESLKSVYLPLIETETRDAMVYRHRTWADADASYGTHSWNSGGRKAQSKHGYEDYDLEGQEMEIYIPNGDINMYNSDNFLGDAKRQQIEKWLQDIDDAVFHGVIDDTGNVKLCDGILDRGANTIIDLSSGGGHDLTAKGEIYLAVKSMIEEVPFRIRENFPDGVNVFVTPTLDEAVRRPDRIYQDKVEFDFIYENLIGPKASPQLKIKNWIVTEKILAKAYDDTAGNNADTADTSGTHDRILVTVPYAGGVARVQSLFDMIGEERELLNIHQAWGWRGAGCVFNEDFVKYSEALDVV